MKEVDLVVVGAGSSGSIVASKISDQTGLRVVVIEAGGSDFRPDIKTPIGYGLTFYNDQVNWCYETTKQENLGDRAVYCPRGKVVGGSGSINAMVYVRGQPGDYDHWEMCSSPDFSWESVKSTFNLLEGHGKNHGSDYIKVTNVEAEHEVVLENFFEAAKQLGIPYTKDMNGEDCGGVGHYPITTRNGFRWTAADAFLKPALRSKKVKILKNSIVARLLVEDKHVAGIELIRKNIKQTIKAKFGVILTAGAINTPQLLMLSGIGPATHLKSKGITPISNIKNIGKNMQDHLGIDYLFESDTPSLNRKLGSWRGRISSLIRYASFRDGPFSLSVNQGGGFINWKSRNSWPNLQIYFNPLTYSLKTPGKRQLLKPDKKDGFALGFQPCRPMSRGEISLNSSDPLDAPIINPKFLSDKRDMYDVEAGIDFIEKMIKSESLITIIKKSKSLDFSASSLAEKKEDFLNRAVSIYHPCGTCSLGQNPDHNPVDLDFKLQGFQNLWVADASTFPSIPSGNINSAVMMMALKAASSISAQINNKLNKFR